MTFNFDKIKHTAGVLAFAAIPFVAPVPQYGKWLALACGFVAFMCGVQSEAMFVKSAVVELEKPDAPKS